ncbi:MAG: hypothetical protein ACW981_21555 [Candidatus Hodarchaeales archaeon]|jgi:DNA-binding Lrp family transcriptional regulator
MEKLLHNALNLKIIELLSSGIGVEIIPSELAKRFKKHRNTIIQKINKIFEYKIINRPLCSFHYIFSIYPLLTIEKSVFTRDSNSKSFIESNPHIMKGFLFKENEYNTLLITLQKDLFSYQNWREEIKKREKITPNKSDYISEAILLSTKNFLKYDASASIQLIYQHFENGRFREINGLKMDELSLGLLKSLTTGNGIKINENFLANKLNVHRHTIRRRIQHLTNEAIITNPVCRFPRIWIPPEYFQVLSLIEVKENKESLINELIKDPRVPVLIKASERHFNLVIFSNFHSMEDHLSWQEEYDQRFSGSIGEVKNSYLSPAMTFNIEQEHISLNFIRKILNDISNNSKDNIRK